MKWPRWASLALVFAALTGALVIWYMLALGDDSVALYRNLSPSDATAVTAALDRENIKYHINANGDVLVASSQEAQARRRLASAHAGPVAVQGFELFDTSDMGLTDFAQKIKYQRALQGELERTIMMMDGVVSARVHISEPDRSLFESEPQTAKAAVTLVTRSPEAETPDRIAGIRRLVAAAVADLSVGDVVILDGHGDILSSDVEVLTADPNRRAAAAAPRPQLLGGPDQSFADLVIVVVGRAIPHTRFSISLSAGVATASNSGAATLAGAAQNALAVSVATDRTLSVEELAAVREALLAAAETSGRTIATIVFNVDSATPESTARATATVPVRRPEVGLNGVALFGTLLTLLTLAALAIAFGLWRRNAKPALSTDQHKSFAAALKASLQDAGGQNEPA